LFNNAVLEEETGSKKADIDTIRAEIMKYHIAADEILRVSNNMMDYPMFRVQATKIKDKLYNAAIVLRKALLDELSTWCNTSVIFIETTYDDMAMRISTVPNNERELV
jgi:LPS O-antigen subunit length determinant protein (WzzB/FepE family)